MLARSSAWAWLSLTPWRICREHPQMGAQGVLVGRVDDQGFVGGRRVRRERAEMLSRASMRMGLVRARWASAVMVREMWVCWGCGVWTWVERVV